MTSVRSTKPGGGSRRQERQGRAPRRRSAVAIPLLLACSLVTILGAPVLVAEPSGVPTEEVLHNGIVLPPTWPPRRTWDDLQDKPADPPYLKNPPAVIPIDVGRQLFVDDFLVQQTTLTRTYHRPKPYPGNPVLKADQPWEEAVAMPFSDGVFYDPRDQRFKLWYTAGYRKGTALAYSTDGLTWEKPLFDVQPGSGVVMPQRWDSSTVWLDLEEPDPLKRFKMFRVSEWRVRIHFSADGVHWGPVARNSGYCGDRTTVFLNPFRKVWVYSIRHDVEPLGRVREYVEGRDVLGAAVWEPETRTPWMRVDRLDESDPRYGIQPQLYNLDCFPYESLMVGLFSIWLGDAREATTEESKRDKDARRPKLNLVKSGFSRDGFHFSRPDRRPFLGFSQQPGDWNWGNVQSALACLVVRDELYFYYSGRKPGEGAWGTCATGLATLRRDGFASMDAGHAGGVLTTRPLRFKGRHLFVNADTPNGALTVEVLGEDGTVIEPFSARACEPVRTNATLHAVRWRDVDALSPLSGKPVRFRFHLKNGSLYAFWVSPDPSGASYGYVGTGGPGFTCSKDTIGGVR